MELVYGPSEASEKKSRESSSGGSHKANKTSADGKVRNWLSDDEDEDDGVGGQDNDEDFFRVRRPRAEDVDIDQVDSIRASMVRVVLLVLARICEFMCTISVSDHKFGC